MNINDLFLCPICRNIPLSERESFLNGLNYHLKTYKKRCIYSPAGRSCGGALFIIIRKREDGNDLRFGDGSEH